MTDHTALVERLRNPMPPHYGKCLQAADTIEALRQSLHDIYWEAMNLGTSNKELDTDEDGWTNESGPFFARGKALHDFARKVIKTAAQQHGVELYK